MCVVALSTCLSQAFRKFSAPETKFAKVLVPFSPLRDYCDSRFFPVERVCLN